MDGKGIEDTVHVGEGNTVDVGDGNTGSGDFVSIGDPSGLEDNHVGDTRGVEGK